MILRLSGTNYLLSTCLHFRSSYRTFIQNQKNLVGLEDSAGTTDRIIRRSDDLRRAGTIQMVIEYREYGLVVLLKQAEQQPRTNLDFLS